MFAYAALVALAAAAIARAEPVPTAPGPGDIFKEGTQCSFTWDVDTTGVWKVMNVQLMTGNNWEMVHLTTVATVDGTDATKNSFTYDCPEVTPNSAIYFYQFSTSAAPTNLTWTTRFTIAAADGSTTPPTNQTEPDGQNIPWGTGALVDPSKAVAAPPYLTSSGTTGSSAANTGTTAAGSTPVVSTTSAAAGTTSAKGSSTSSKLVTAAAAPTTSSSANSTSSNSTGSAGNGAASLLGSDSYAVRAGVALGLAAFTFAFAL